MRKTTYQDPNYPEEQVMLYENILMDIRYFKEKFGEESYQKLKREIEEIK